MNIANTKQVLTALGILVQNAADITGLKLTTEEVEFVRGKPVDAVLWFRDCYREWKKRHVIPESTDTNPNHDFKLGRVTDQLPNLTYLKDLEKFISDNNGTFDPLLNDAHLRDKMFSEIRKDQGQSSFKIMTTHRMGFVDYVPNEVFMNNDFLEKWSQRHYRGFKLELCDHFDIVDCLTSMPSLLANGGLESDRVYTFATKPGKHRSSASFILNLSTHNKKSNILCGSYHEPLTLVNKIILRVVPVKI